MSKLPGLTILSKDPEIDNKAVTFVNIDNTDQNEPIFIAGTALDVYEENNTSIINSSEIDHIAHGKFSKLSLVTMKDEKIDGFKQNENGIEHVGIFSYVYIDNETGQLKSNTFDNYFKDNPPE